MRANRPSFISNFTLTTAQHIAVSLSVFAFAFSLASKVLSDNYMYVCLHLHVL